MGNFNSPRKMFIGSFTRTLIKEYAKNLGHKKSQERRNNFVASYISEKFDDELKKAHGNLFSVPNSIYSLAFKKENESKKIYLDPMQFIPQHTKVKQPIIPEKPKVKVPQNKLNPESKNIPGPDFFKSVLNENISQLEEERKQNPLVFLKRNQKISKVKSSKKSPISEPFASSVLIKLEPLLKDASIQTIECPGPDKPILVYRSGVIQPTNLVLNTPDVKNVMREISEKTKIPLIPGVFKAAFDRFIITAVVSDLVGTRFIIQRKNVQ